MCFPSVCILKTTIMIIKVAPKNTDDIRSRHWAFVHMGLHSEQMRHKSFRVNSALDFRSCSSEGWDPVLSSWFCSDENLVSHMNLLLENKDGGAVCSLQIPGFILGDCSTLTQSCVCPTVILWCVYHYKEHYSWNQRASEIILFGGIPWKELCHGLGWNCVWHLLQVQSRAMSFIFNGKFWGKQMCCILGFLSWSQK